MPSINARVTALEKKVRRLEKKIRRQEIELAKHDREIVKLKDWRRKVELWIKKGTVDGNMVKWANKVTAMLHEIDWADLKAHFPGGGGDNPPQTPPDYPPGES